MSYCASLKHKLAGLTDCCCGLANAQQGAALGALALQQKQGVGQVTALDQYNALRNNQTRTVGGLAFEALRHAGAWRMAQWPEQANQARSLSHKRPCELCDSEAHGGALTKASDGSQHWIDMCHDCARAAGAIR